MKRLFLAINILDDIKKKISKKKENLESMIPGADFTLPGATHVTPQENWHLTLIFLGYQEDEAVLPIINSMQNIVSSFNSPEIILNDISYAPPKGAPRMIWVNGTKETSQNLSSLKIALENELIKNKVRFKLENREFNSHITLARFVEMPKEELPEIGAEYKNLNWFFIPESVDLMESHLSGSGVYPVKSSKAGAAKPQFNRARYEILQSINFKED